MAESLPNPSFEEDVTKAGRRLFTAPATFLLGVVTPAQLPESMLPEVTFAGRSNVGKSSLINALTNRKTLARTSITPGRTQEINFFHSVHLELLFWMQFFPLLKENHFEL